MQLAQLDKVEPELQRVESAMKEAGERPQSCENFAIISWEVAAIRAVSECGRGNLQPGIARILSLKQVLPDGDPYFLGWLDHCLAEAYEAIGELKFAEECFDQGRKFAAEHNLNAGFLHSSWTLANLFMQEGKLRKAESICKQAIAYGHGEGPANLFTLMHEITLARISLERMDGEPVDKWLNEAVTHADQIAESANSYMGLHFLFNLAEVYLVYQDLKQSQMYLDMAIVELKENHVVPVFPLSEMVDIQIRIWEAAHVLSTKDKSFITEVPFSKFANLPEIPLQIALARIYLAHNDPMQALPVLREVETRSRLLGLGARLIEVLLLEALANRIMGQEAQAFDCLQQALDLGEPEGYMHIFIREGEPAKALFERFLSDRRDLSQSAGNKGNQPYAWKILQAFGKAPSIPSPNAIAPDGATALINPDQLQLTNREQEVLDLLTAEKSTKEVAAALTISINTAKTHVRNIRRKLGDRVIAGTTAE